MPHTTSVKVRFYELDPYDHVNHTNYIAYFETARIEYLSELGFGLDVMKGQGLQIVVVALRASFHAAAGLHDLLAVTTEVVDVGRVRSTWHQEMRRGDEVVATLEIDAAFVGADGRPRRTPEAFIRRMERDDTRAVEGA